MNWHRTPAVEQPTSSLHDSGRRVRSLALVVGDRPVT
jgi:hypothetical protein